MLRFVFFMLRKFGIIVNIERSVLFVRRCCVESLGGYIFDGIMIYICVYVEIWCEFISLKFYMFWFRNLFLIFVIFWWCGMYSCVGFFLCWDLLFLKDFV